MRLYCISIIFHNDIIPIGQYFEYQNRLYIGTLKKVNPPFTVTEKVQVNSSFLPFSATQVTSVFPISNSDPDGGMHVTSIFLPLVSIANRSLQTTIAVDLLGSVDSIKLAGQTGSTTLKKIFRK